ncbi:MAG: poly(R)-hydroxyalkanoic acid synthase subunit PhaE [Arhodomonas sp.]|nr:poly(R)-hydroxyalkanoic acid synthase subunit PhaE [Arhodomonas sp.]
MGPAGSVNRKLDSLAEATRQWHVAAVNMAGELAGLIARALEQYADGERAAPSSSPAERQQRWTQHLELSYERALAEEDMGTILGELWGAALAVRHALTELMDDVAPSLGLPSRAELTNLQERLARLESAERG